ncbi:hypothetical protein LDENG_00256290 [Lucifuga dentata]|nr:hypothetical protein LDENG_00256290 [Lucifuga dentata]
MELRTLLEGRVKGALVRSRFCNIKDMDVSSSFFFNLERNIGRRKLMTCLKLSDGKVTTDPKEMRKCAVDFYTNLFSADCCKPECVAELLEGLPQLSPAEKAGLDRGLSMEELTTAVGQMASGRAPGLDGLTADFYKRFWGSIGADLHEVLLECQLYSLAIEPLLCRLRDRLSGFSLPGSSQSSPPLVVSAYADDVNILVQNQRDVEALRDSLGLYERASSARVNWGKSEAFQVGRWEEEAVPALPGGLRWGNRGLKVLGVYLATEGFQQQNWEGVREKVCAKLSKWKWLLPQLSYRDRVLVINNLVASTLWHRLNVLSPPRGFIEDIQRTLVNFFWPGPGLDWD